MDTFYFAMALLILSLQVVTGCSTGGGIPGNSGTAGKAPPSGGERVARRAIRDYRERHTPNLMFSALDKDNNGNIDACEWMQSGMTSNVREFVKSLDEVDSNADNVLSVEEFQALKFQLK